jgi:hypothetical protein
MEHGIEQFSSKPYSSGYCFDGFDALVTNDSRSFNAQSSLEKFGESKFGSVGS